MAVYDLLRLPSPDVREVIERMPVAVIPFGSVEQHGAHLPCGTDVFAAEGVAKALAEKLGCLFVPFGPYGTTAPHIGLPGTISLSRSTFEGLIRDISHQLIAGGVKLLIMLNWHEAHSSAIQSVCAEVQKETGAKVVLAHAHFVAQRIYGPEGGRLTHAGSIETLAVMAHDPDLVHADRFKTPHRTAKAEALDAMRRSHEVYGFVTDVRDLSEDGWYGDPSWAKPEAAVHFTDRVASEVAKRLFEVWDVLGVDRPSPAEATAA